MLRTAPTWLGQVHKGAAESAGSGHLLIPTAAHTFHALVTGARHLRHARVTRRVRRFRRTPFGRVGGGGWVNPHPGPRSTEATLAACSSSSATPLAARTGPRSGSASTGSGSSMPTLPASTRTSAV